MASKFKGPRDSRGNNDDVNGDSPAEGEVVRRKYSGKRKRGNIGHKKCTLDIGKKNILAPIKVLEPPLFQTKECIDVGATDNLFMYKLRTNPATHRLSLMSSKKNWHDDPDEVLQRAMKLDVGMELPKLKNYTMLLPFKDFEITDWDPEEEENQPLTLENVVLDDQGIPIVELDGSVHDIFSDDNVNEDPISDVEEQAQVFQAQSHDGIEHITDSIPEEHRVENDYGFNSMVRTTSGKLVHKLWAGPSHWKVKFNKRSNARFSGASDQQPVKRRRKGKSPTPVDFTKDPPDYCEVYDKFVNKGGLTVAPLEKILLPESLSDDYERILTHYLSKRDVPRPKRLLYSGSNSNLEEPDVQLYNDHTNDSQHNSNDGHDNEPFHNFFGEEPSTSAQGNFLDENLVEAPALVRQTHVPYALQAKKMDMKKLKAAMWECLTKNKSTNNEIEATHFSALYKQLPTKLTQEMKKELTCPLTFVALLHLCNENSLALRRESRADFTIMNA